MLCASRGAALDEATLPQFLPLVREPGFPDTPALMLGTPVSCPSSGLPARPNVKGQTEGLGRRAGAAPIGRPSKESANPAM